MDGKRLTEKNLTPSLRADPSLLGKGEKLIRRAYVFPYSDPTLQGLPEMNLTPSLRADPSLLGKGEKLIRHAYVSPYSDPALKGRAI